MARQCGAHETDDGVARRAEPSAPWAAIEAAVRGLRFGTVVIVVQDGRVVQIEKTEKLRLT
jgi:hypothetical protein